MRILLSFGFVAAISATAGAQLGSTAWSPTAPAPDSMQVVPDLGLPQSMDATTRHRRDRRMPIADNPYRTASDDVALGTHELGDIGPAPGLEGNPYARLGQARPHLAGNPYYVSSLDDGRDRVVDNGRPVVFEMNPYLY